MSESNPFQPDLTSAVVLNVDDQEHARYTKTRLLRKAGYKVIEAVNGQEALDVAQSKLPDAIMLDVEGFVAETNATNLFIVRKDELLTPRSDHCLPGITRRAVLELARANSIAAIERPRVSLSVVIMVVPVKRRSAGALAARRSARVESRSRRRRGPALAQAVDRRAALG